MYETSGVLAAVEAYLTRGEELSTQHVLTLRACLRQWMPAPWAGPGIADLRRRIDTLCSRDDFDGWFNDARRFSSVFLQPG